MTILVFKGEILLKLMNFIIEKDFFEKNNFFFEKRLDKIGFL